MTEVLTPDLVGILVEEDLVARHPSTTASNNSSLIFREPQASTYPNGDPHDETPWDTIAIDLDGTLINTRWPDFDEEKLLDYEPIEGSLEVVRRIYDAGFRVMLWTSRPERLRTVTEEWLRKHDVPYHELRMDKPAYLAFIDDRALNFDGEWNGILGRALAFQTWWEVLRDGPKSFEQALADELKLMRTVMIDRQRKYGPANMLAAGIQGALKRAKEDKMARLDRYYAREAFRQECLAAGMPLEIVDKYAPRIQDFEDEKLDDTHVDAANYVGPISLMLRHGTWNLPMGEELPDHQSPDELEGAA